MTESVSISGSNTGGSGHAMPVSRPSKLWAANVQSVLAHDLMDRVIAQSNLKRAFAQVARNKGAPGIDKVSIREYKENLDANLLALHERLVSGHFRPLPVRPVEIPKPNGKGVRQLGIPTVEDRVVQQAITQILQPIFDPTFSDASYGFRPKRSTHDAIRRSRAYIEQGRKYVVDIDLSKFFDTVNHDLLMGRLGSMIRDKKLLKLIGRYLRAGVLKDGVQQKAVKGTAQGSPLSPLMSNVMLDRLDKWFEGHGYYFVRYADDFQIYAKSETKAKKIMDKTTAFIEKRLKLVVNQEKSAVGKIDGRSFLGFKLASKPEKAEIRITKAAVKSFKDKVRKKTKRNRGKSIFWVISDLNRLIRGWCQYFGIADVTSVWKRLDAWIRRRLRCYRMSATQT